MPYRIDIQSIRMYLAPTFRHDHHDPIPNELNRSRIFHTRQKKTSKIFILWEKFQMISATFASIFDECEHKVIRKFFSTFLLKIFFFSLFFCWERFYTKVGKKKMHYTSIVFFFFFNDGKIREISFQCKY